MALIQGAGAIAAGILGGKGIDQSGYAPRFWSVVKAGTDEVVLVKK